MSQEPEVVGERVCGCALVATHEQISCTGVVCFPTPVI